jgi:hypothetical protein
MEGEADHHAAHDFVDRRYGDLTLTAGVRVAVNLDDSVFPVQGPPGAGKAYTANDLRACARRQADRDHGKQSQSHP